MGFRSGRTGEDTKVTGQTINVMVKVNSITWMAMCMKAIGSMIEHMDMERISMQMG